MSRAKTEPWKSLTISMVTISEIGMKYVIRSHQVMVVIQKFDDGMYCVTYL